ncbi:peptidyl-prolyl cis-trans isomerase CYP59 isoform X1 [Coffea eugenioides]|uniref:Peptidyl-prolyl cis-trans isomerase n=1 Tax=Coffea arabica TaxID=13443 RepID=A0A6P6S8I3_COFAR|nr:peptidyl-prolyl cis-trans isomerase CYP59 isoform X1 [Coffea eugenioides]
MSVMIVTSLGDIVVDLFTDRCPLTCKNFLKLCKIKYYNGCLFHTVQKDFTAQTGDPTGTGSGGDSVYKFLYGDQARFFGDEIHLDLKHSKMGTVAMASAGENLNASQFYITLRDDLDYLDGKHTVFGEVAEGLETLSRINEAYVDENSRPYKNIRIKHTYILDDPFDDPAQLAELLPDASPEGKPKDEVDDDVRLEDDWVPMDESLGPQQLEEVLRAKEAHSRAVVLESIGDIPEAEVKPPDNVLFVCKLNPVTEDGDLHTIFSRFGTVTSADIIRDYKTGDSLCYAFIEFEDREACEQAYFKMDNALIDDRRIHVDFSQSVSKLWSQYRRGGRMNKGKGCFKCGSLDHIAKDCTGDPTNAQQHSKYILKDGNTQHGGDDNSRYEMVFGGEDLGSPKGNKRERYSEPEKSDRREDWKSAGLDNQERDGTKDSQELRSHRGRSKELREDDKYRGDRASRHSGRDRGSTASDEGDYRRKAYGGSERDGREGVRYEKRHRDDASHRDNQYGREYKERRAGDVGWRDRRDERDSMRRKGGDEVRRSQKVDENDHNSRHESKGRKHYDMETRKGRSEERESGKRKAKVDDAADVGDYERDRSRRR